MESELIFEDLSNVFANTSSLEEGEQLVETEHEETVANDDDEHHTTTHNAYDQAQADAIASIQLGGEVDVDDITDEEAMLAHQFITTDGSFLPQPIENAPDVEVSLEDQLKSTEKLDRSSPDLFPKNLSATAKQVLHNHRVKTGEADTSGCFASGLDPEDINLLHQFGSLTSSSLVEEVKKLQNIAYQLSLEEKREMQRGKLLHALD